MSIREDESPKKDSIKFRSETIRKNKANSKNEK